MDLNFKKTDKFWIIAIAVLLFVVGYIAINKWYESRMLENTSTVLGIIKKKGKGSAKDGPYAIFQYSVQNENYDLRVWGDFKDSSVTKYYCVEYSIEDHSVARLTKLSVCSD